MTLEMTLGERLDKKRQEEWYAELYKLLAERTQRSTGCTDSSVPLDTVQDLLKSLQYAIETALEAEPMDPSLELPSPKALWEQGQRELKRLQRRGKLLLHQVRRMELPTDNIAYRDTLTELDRFFMRYDETDAAHELPCSIDYPLCRPIADEPSGVRYVVTYLGELCVEGELLHRIRPERLIAVWQAAVGDSAEAVFNLYRPVAEDVLFDELPKGFCVTTETETALTLDMAAVTAAGKLRLGQRSEELLRYAAAELLPRLMAAAETDGEGLGGVFPLRCL